MRSSPRPASHLHFKPVAYLINDDCKATNPTSNRINSRESLDRVIWLYNQLKSTQRLKTTLKLPGHEPHYAP